MKVKAGTLIHTPPGYIVLSIVAKRCESVAVRWSNLADTEQPVAMEVLRELLQQHEYLEHTDYKIVHDLLTA